MPFGLEVFVRQILLGVSALVFFALTACQGVEAEPELLVVSDISPRQLELGDRVEIVGDGFPEGRPARVELVGELHRVGEPGARPFRRSFEAKSGGRNLVTFVPNERELEQLVGSGDAAAHTTFRGELRLAFSSQRAHPGPVHGTLRDVVVDAFPWRVPEAVRRQRLLEAERFSQFIGVSLDPKSFEVTLVKPRSRAEQAGVRASDRLLALDGVRLIARSDFSVAGASALAQLSVGRGRLQDPIELQLPVGGFKPVAPSTLGNAALLVAFVAALLLVFSAPSVRILTFLERRLVQGFAPGPSGRRAVPVGVRHSIQDTLLGRDLLPGGVLGALLRPVPYLIFLGASAMFALLANGQSLAGADLDLGVLFLLSVLMLVCSAALCGGWKSSGGGWSLGRGLKAAFGALLFQIPAALALGSVLIHSGTLSPSELVARQGLLPWEYHAFESPMLLVASMALLATCLPESSRHGQASSRQEMARPVEHAVSHNLAFFAELGHVFVVSGLAAILFFGGWTLAAGPGRAGALQLLAQTGLLQFKTLLLVSAVLSTRWALSRLSRRELHGIWWRWVLPLSSAALLLSIVYQRGIDRYALLRDAAGGMSLVLFLLTLSVLVYLAARVANAARQGSAKLSAFSLNPWL